MSSKRWTPAKRHHPNPCLSHQPDEVARLRRGATPLWRQAAEAIEARIKSGQLREGGRLPAETILSQEFGINRHTLRRAIDDLVEQGKLRRIPRTGVIVAPLKIPFVLDASTTFVAAMETAGLQSVGKFHSKKLTTSPPEHIPKLLQVATKTTLLELEHGRDANDRPLCYITSWLPADRFQRVGEYYAITKSLRRAYSQCGVPEYFRKSVRITSRSADAVEARRLEVPVGSIIFVLEVVYVDPTDEPIQVGLFRFSADRCEFIVEPR